MTTSNVIRHTAPHQESLTDFEAHVLVREALLPLDLSGKRVLLIVPDGTRTAPVGLMFRAIHTVLASIVSQLDVMTALGTHPPMSETEIETRLEITHEERVTTYRNVQLLNHAWDNPTSLVSLGRLGADEIKTLSDGLFEQEVEVTINRAALDYEQLLIVGPVFPHEVVGFSGGNKYLFPGIGGSDILNFFHWLGAVITNPGIIGNKWTPVRQVVDRAASLLPTPRFAFCLVVDDHGLAGIFAGSPEAAWSKAADLSAERHVITVPRPFHTVLSCAPPMYDELWVAGKCMYKLENVVEDNGELIIYAPHLREISRTHGEVIERIGYHIRDYFLAQWEQFKHEPWGVLAHSTHVRGIGTYEDGIEKPRITVTLATQISEATCRKINLGYRDPASIRPEDFLHRESEGILCVPQAGERLYRLDARG